MHATQKKDAPVKSYSSLSKNLHEFLSKRGVTPNAGFHDYQDYIEKKQKKLPTTIVRKELVPAHGSVHLAMGKIFKTAELGFYSKIVRWICK